MEARIGAIGSSLGMWPTDPYAQMPPKRRPSTADIKTLFVSMDVVLALSIY